MKNISEQTEQELRLEFTYCASTGTLERSRKRGVKKEVQGALDYMGYRTVGFTGSEGKFMIKKHRLCVFLGTGKWPVFVRFRNGDMNDFRLENLEGLEKRVLLDKLEEKTQELGPDYKMIYGTQEDWNRLEDDMNKS